VSGSVLVGGFVVFGVGPSLWSFQALPGFGVPGFGQALGSGQAKQLILRHKDSKKTLKMDLNTSFEGQKGHSKSTAPIDI